MEERRAVRITLALLIVGTTACASAPSPGGSPRSSARAASPTDRGTPSAAPSDDAVVVVPEVLRFEAPLLAGGSLRGDTLAGQDVAFWFWAPW